MIIKREDFDKKVNKSHVFAAEAGDGRVYLCTRITYIVKHCLKYKLEEFQILKALGAEECAAYMEDLENDMLFDDEENIDRLNDIYQLCENSLHLYIEYLEVTGGDIYDDFWFNSTFR